MENRIGFDRFLNDTTKALLEDKLPDDWLDVQVGF